MRKELTTVLFYEIELTTIPKIKYNCPVTAFGYRASVSKKEDLFELCYIEGGECVCQFKDDALICEAGHLYPLIFAEDCEIYSEINAPTKMYSVGIESGFNISLIDSEKLSEEDARLLMKRLLSGSRFLLPKEGVSSYQCDWLPSYMKKIIMWVIAILTPLVWKWHSPLVMVSVIPPLILFPVK